MKNLVCNDKAICMCYNGCIHDKATIELIAEFLPHVPPILVAYGNKRLALDSFGHTTCFTLGRLGYPHISMPDNDKGQFFLNSSEISTKFDNQQKWLIDNHEYIDAIRQFGIEEENHPIFMLRNEPTVYDNKTNTHHDNFDGAIVAYASKAKIDTYITNDIDIDYIYRYIDFALLFYKAIKKRYGVNILIEVR